MFTEIFGFVGEVTGLAAYVLGLLAYCFPVYYILKNLFPTFVSGKKIAWQQVTSVFAGFVVTLVLVEYAPTLFGLAIQRSLGRSMVIYEQIAIDIAEGMDSSFMMQGTIPLTEEPQGQGQGSSIDLLVPIQTPVIGVTRHTVSQGETLQGIAEMYGITVGMIRAQSSFLGDEVSPGIILEIPPPPGWLNRGNGIPVRPTVTNEPMILEEYTVSTPPPTPPVMR